MNEGCFVVGLEEIDGDAVAWVGGKGARLGALSRMEDARVPPGLVVTTAAYARALGAGPLGSREGPEMPDEVAAEIVDALARLGDEGAYAVRSSATAEDSDAASFAGQHDSFLGVVGGAAVLAHVRRCWASLHTERAAAYRRRQGLDERRVGMAVVVQRMVAARASGVLFTADPETGHRRVSVVEATPGLGEALASGRARADRFAVRGDEVAVRARVHPVGATLSDPQVLELARLGRRIEAHFGAPQDIEWCLADDGFHVVQSRPITTLFPVPVVHDAEPHVFVSVGHQQMMTDAMRPLGISVWQLTAGRPMHEAGGRLFVDVARALASPAGREGLLAMLGRSDPLSKDALEVLVARGDIADQPAGGPLPVPGGPPPLLDPDPALVAELVGRAESSFEALEGDIAGRSGVGLVDFILADIQELRRLLFDPRSAQAIMTAVQATWWLEEHLAAWLGDTAAADALARSAPNNVTAEMGLALLEVADVIRPFPAVVAALEAARDDRFMEALGGVPGGREARAALEGFLDRFGMRCVGEIDLTTPRWAERPTALLPIVLGHVRSLAPGEAARRVARGAERAARAEADVLARLRLGADGASRADEAKRMIDRVRAFIGYREHPKYTMVRRYAVYRRALLAEAARLVAAGVLADAEDLFYLTLPELREVVTARAVDADLIRRRREDHRSHRALRPPRVLTSDGEIITGAYRRTDLPAGALPGLAISGGTVEGRARVVTTVGAAALEPDDILVTEFTDPSWTPLFVGIKGLVTEVGGLMSHGSVIARELGLPAVVGVEGATRLIRDGRRIRIDGTRGCVELLPD